MADLSVVIPWTMCSTLATLFTNTENADVLSSDISLTVDGCGVPIGRQVPDHDTTNRQCSYALREQSFQLGIRSHPRQSNRLRRYNWQRIYGVEFAGTAVSSQ